MAPSKRRGRGGAGSNGEVLGQEKENAAQLNQMKLNEHLEKSLRAAEHGKWEDSVEYARNALDAAGSHGDADAVTLLAFSLVRLDKPHEALQYAQPLAEKQCSGLVAYCLYRRNKFSEAISACDRAPEPLASAVRGQCLHRLGRYADASAAFELAIAHGAGYECRVNALAAAASAGTQAILSDRVLPQGESFEEEYNYASLNVQLGYYEDAHARLLRARKLGSESLLDEGLSSDEAAEELRPLDAQLAVCCALRGYVHEASSHALEVLNAETSDAAAVATAAVAFASISFTVDEAQQALYALERVSPPPGAGETTFSMRAPRALKQHAKEARAAMLLIIGEAEKARLAAAAAAPTAAGSELPALVQAAASVQSRRYVKAEGVLEGKHSSRAAMARAHVCALRGNALKAASVLASSSVAYAPATAATVVSLHQAAGKASRSLQTLQQCVNSCEEKQHPALPVALDELAMLNAEIGRHKQAADLLQRFLKVSDDVSARNRALARLSKLLATEEASDVSTKLPAPSTDDLPSVDTLVEEAKQSLSDESVQHKVAASVAFTGASNRRRRRSSQQRKKRMPKNASMQSQPDPERWIPKKERSTATKGKGKKKQHPQQQQQQGASVGTQQQQQHRPQLHPEQQQAGGASSKRSGKRRGGKKP